MILAIDPGSSQSAWLWYDTLPGHWTGGVGRPTAFGISPNADVLAALRGDGGPDDLAEPLADIEDPEEVVVIETIEPRYGLQMGWETLDTARWIGRFEEAAQPTAVVLLKRSEILRHLGVVTSPRKGEKRVSADSGVHQALLDRFGGKDVAVGRKASPGPLYGISKDVWSALAIAVTYAEGGTA